MLRKTSIISVSIVCMLAAATARGQNDGMAELARLESQGIRDHQRKQAEVEAEARKQKPIVETLADSLSLQGNGLGACNRGSCIPVMLQKCTLYYIQSEDYDQRYLFFYLDNSSNFQQELKAQQEQLRAYDGAKNIPAEAKARLDKLSQGLKQVRTPAELALLQYRVSYEAALQGAAALTPAQASRIAAGLAKHYQLAEDLARLVEARNKTPNSVPDEKLLKTFTDWQSAQAFMGPDGDLYTPAQRRVLGYDVDPNAPAMGGRRHSAVAAASASAGTPANMGAADAVYAKAEAERKAEEDAARKASKVNFTLKGKNAYTNRSNVHTHEGLLVLYVEAPQQYSFGATTTANFTACLYGADSLNAKMVAGLNTEAYAKGTLSPAFKDGKDFVEGYYTTRWSHQLKRLAEKTGSVPTEVQQRLDALVKDIADASDGALKAYQTVLSKPTDAAAQRAFFKAVQQALRAERRCDTLALNRENYDPEGTNDQLPWLLTMDQVDLVNSGQPSSGSSVSSSSDGSSVSIRARPAGDKQYVCVTAENSSLGTVVGDVLSSARRFYHNHRLKLIIDPAAEGNPLRGMAEGKSPEELFQSLALRSGTKLIKDEKDPNVFTLKL